MTNKERQLSLDKKKWAESEKVGYDMSGKMFYCEQCKNCVSQHEREKFCICATAYNRLKRKSVLKK